MFLNFLGNFCASLSKFPAIFTENVSKLNNLGKEQQNPWNHGSSTMAGKVGKQSEFD